MSVLLLLMFWRIPSQPVGEISKVDGPRRHLGHRIARAVIPGVFDVELGSLLRGFLTFVLLTFVLLVAYTQAHARLQGLKWPGPGPFTMNNGEFRGILLPTPPDVVDELSVASHFYWTFFWAYPYAKAFWTIVALSVLALVVLHGQRLRQIWVSETKN